MKHKEIINVVCSIIERNGDFLLAQRPDEKALPLKWEFPGGKVNEKEKEDDALKREIKEELGIDIEVYQKLSPSLHRYSDFTINLIPYRCRISRGEPIPHEHIQIRWIDIESAKDFDIAAADLPILEEYTSLIRGKI